MGSCLCRGSKPRRETVPGRNNQSVQNSSSSADNGQNARVIVDDSFRLFNTSVLPVEEDVRQLIAETLRLIRNLVNNDQEPPASLMKLNMVADREDGWQLVVRCLIESIPEHSPLGAAVITLFLDESPLPSREAVSRLIFRLGLGSVPFANHSWHWHRNACIVLGSLAEKMAGASSAALCTPTTLNYLINNLNENMPTEVILFSLIALEKFAQTTENRLMICRSLEEMKRHPLEILERWVERKAKKGDALVQQVAFCAQWSLDNIFVREGRTYSCMLTDVSGINAMLNHHDVSEYLKIGPDGLQARCDVTSFESVRCTFEVPQHKRAVWYYEATILTAGVMQIGFATKRSRFLNHEGFGIGDDEHSVAYDGCRQLIWHGAKGERVEGGEWRAGDVVGCLLDTRRRHLIVTVNGRAVSHPHKDIFTRMTDDEGIFAAASFMSFQHCVFNFGASPFRFPPSTSYMTFNNCGATLTMEEKTILPRRRRVEESVCEMAEGSCCICYEREADTVCSPCMHGGVCHHCALQLTHCPFCRHAVQERLCVEQPAVPALPTEIPPNP